jgi:hypothetical protein
MRAIISALLICISSTWAFAQDSQPLELAPDAPDRHIVVPGDTLWGIAKLFLKDPYRWSEIWRLNNDDIKNPHRIYPGQVVILDKSGDKPLLKLGRLVNVEPHIYIDDNKHEIPAIPQQVIEPFLAKPLVLEPSSLDEAARIVAIKGDRLGVGNGDTVYATKLKSKAEQWQVIRAGKPINDPDQPDTVLGLEAQLLGSARLTAEGEPATLQIVTASQEIGRNDYLIPAPHPDIITYAPHAPAGKIAGRVVKLFDGLGEGGRLSIVSLSRGKRDGLEVGHVLALHRKGATVTNTFEDRKETYSLPDERYGLLFIFRVFDRVSYALVMNANGPVLEGDMVATP